MSGEGWVPGVDFDPHDPDEMEIMHVVWEGERLSAIERLEKENSRLRGIIAQMEEGDEPTLG